MGKPILLPAILLVLTVVGANLYIGFLKGQLGKSLAFLQQQHDFLQSTLNSIAEGVIVTNSEGISFFPIVRPGILQALAPRKWQANTLRKF